jgi:hypothetical protein
MAAMILVDGDLVADFMEDGNGYGENDTCAAYMDFNRYTLCSACFVWDFANRVWE